MPTDEKNRDQYRRDQGGSSSGMGSERSGSQQQGGSKINQPGKSGSASGTDTGRRSDVGSNK
jgi:hypothetical protein